MRAEDRNHVFTVGFIVAIACVVMTSIVTWQLAEREIRYDRQADYYAAEYAGRTDQEVLKACQGPIGLDLIKCLRGELESQRNTKRDEADLAAQQQMSEWAFWVLVVSALTLIFTALGVWLVILNLREARKVTTQSAHANENAVRANAHAFRHAQMALRESRTANQIASQASERQLRAYVILDDITYSDEVVPSRVDPDLRIFVYWKNAGVTPAKSVQWDVNYSVIAGDLPDDFEFAPSNDLHKGILGPGQATRDVSVLVSSDDVANAIHGVGNLYVWGWIEYSDVFFDTPRRRSEFCIEVEIDQDTNGIRDYTTHTTSKHNGTDQDCLKEAMTGP